MCGNWSAPFNYVSSNLSDLKNKFEILMKIIQSTRKRPRFIYCIPSPGDWQDDVRSSLYFQIWCSCIWDSGLVVWSPDMTLMTWVRFLAGSIFWNFKFRFLWYFHMFRGIYTHIWTEIITTTIAWWLCVSQLSSWSRVQFLSKSECPERSFGDIRNCWFDWCSLKRPRPWWGVRSGWL